MRKIKIGDKLQVHCYKHDGSLHRVCDEATVLDISDNVLVCANDKTKIVEKDIKKKYNSYYTKEPAILFFYKDSWFNIIGQIKTKGLFFYCNIASPFIIDDGIIKYIDYDLDLRVFPDGSFMVLDRNEYRYHKKEMNYGKDIEKIIQKELTRLIEMEKNKDMPFDKKIVEYYYNIYEKMTTKSHEK